MRGAWALGAVLCASLLPAASVRAATLTDVVTRDDLGHECVPEALLEAAFAMSGKGARLPRTCNPRPCAMPDRADLDWRLGIPATDREWEDERRRYAERCVAHFGWPAPEADAPDLPPIAMVDLPPDGPGTLVHTDSRRPSGLTVRSHRTPSWPSGGRTPSAKPPKGSLVVVRPPFDPRPPTDEEPRPKPPGARPSPHDEPPRPLVPPPLPTPVPLPLTGLLLAGALGLLPLVRRLGG